MPFVCKLANCAWDRIVRGATCVVLAAPRLVVYYAWCLRTAANAQALKSSFTMIRQKLLVIVPSAAMC